jgi:hypothetical protein
LTTLAMSAYTNGTCASAASARATNVLPVPGGPYLRQTVRRSHGVCRLVVVVVVQ